MRYQIRDEKYVYQGRLFKIKSSRLDYGGQIFRRETVVHPGAAAMIPLFSRHQIVLVRQFRYAAKRELWEIPAGTLDNGETPLQCAWRELAEETGYTARSFRKLASFYPCPGYSSEIIHLYEASKLIRTSAYPDADENIKIRIFNRSEIKKLLISQRIVDAKTIIGLMIWLKK